MMEGGKALAEGLKGNTIMTELNLAANGLAVKADRSDHDMAGVIAIAEAIPTMGALVIGCTVVIDGLTKSPALNGKEATVVQRIKMKDASIEAYEVKIVETGEQKKLKRSNLIGGKNNGTLTTLNLSSNRLQAEGAKHVAEAIKVNVSALCFDWYRPL